MNLQEATQQGVQELPSNNQNDSEVQFMLAEYGRQQQKFQIAVETVNQTFNIYIAILAVLMPVSVGAISFWPQNRLLLGLATASFSIVAAAASLFTLLRSFHSRMEQTDAEKALCRLRNYFIAHHPNLSIYISEPIHDDWPTPYTHRWWSTTFYGWVALTVATGVFVGISILCLLLAFQLNWAYWLILASCISSGSITFILCYLLIDRKLKGKKQREPSRFPKVSSYLQHKHQL